ncbi:uncharacterized protein K452DRAFT_349793 [Aplosporella prunicola CBS 121167]|uniref:FAD-binding PCMH-type domain-containing protein n=1 Tax=Aplosporella prunicola CBS 121167 TaxID=1176127 RepID=A0A6A6BQF4_9PEZI|nr:uncharacterized protein K452DRAFT_349793 [Aplosporella prunicola CBS 121167]KAF2144811.1 hypothetical protein K452DRAFT_349793 [Aplosporella prunicola CBS 121167]
MALLLALGATRGAAAAGAASTNSTNNNNCKTTPTDASWPAPDAWAALNTTLNGRLIQTVPAAAVCYGADNILTNTTACQAVSANWSSSIFHAALPESIDYPLYANESCLPPGASGYVEGRGCSLGGLPEYVVDAKTEEDVAAAMKWAAEKGIRVVVKGTGHDLSGRSSGAFALSIWTHNFLALSRDTAWRVPGTNTTEDVFIAGSGHGWGDVLNFALQHNRVVTTGQDPSVGLGGYIQGGGHGPLSSYYGLAAHQVLQMRVVTTTGDVLVADDIHNSDLFWALRGGGGGQYGVVTQYVIRHFPEPAHVMMGTLQMMPRSGSEAAANASWNAAVELYRAVPDMVDAGLTGSATMSTGKTASKFAQMDGDIGDGVVITQVLFAYNMSADAMTGLVDPVVKDMLSHGANDSIKVVWSPGAPQNYSAFFDAISGSNVAGAQSLMSSRLLGRAELIDTPREVVGGYLRRLLASQAPGAGTYSTIGLQGGPGVHGVEAKRWGAVNPVWRNAYLHFMAGGADMDTEADGAAGALDKAAQWVEETKEKTWREWAPKTGAYMNEANPFNQEFKHDFYGESYERLLSVKRKYDRSESLFVLSGVGSDAWEYDLSSGKLCRKE